MENTTTTDYSKRGPQEDKKVCHTLNVLVLQLAVRRFNVNVNKKLHLKNNTNAHIYLSLQKCVLLVDHHI